MQRPEREQSLSDIARALRGEPIPPLPQKDVVVKNLTNIAIQDAVYEAVSSGRWGVTIRDPETVFSFFILGIEHHKFKSKCRGQIDLSGTVSQEGISEMGASCSKCGRFVNLPSGPVYQGLMQRIKESEAEERLKQIHI